ncbi:MAG: acetate--CoA ligase family protein [Dehalococcoidia bacterium]
MPSEVIAQARSQGRVLLNEVESKRLLEEFGIETSGAQLATSAEEAVRIAGELGYPIALKILSQDIAHKSDIGGVRLGLGSEADVKAAFHDIMEAVQQRQPEARVDGASVQRMAEPGVEVIVGMSRDPQFGPVLMFGLGGVFVELLKDVSFRLPPLEPRDAREMIGELKTAALLDGYRGTQPASREKLEQLLLHVSRFVEAHPEVVELDLNPVFAYPDGAVAVDARIILAE